MDYNLDENMEYTDELKNENPIFLTTLIQYFTEFLSHYGWYVLLALIICIYIYKKVCERYLESYQRRKSEREYAARYHKNPDLFLSRQTAMEEARRKMQDKYNEDVEKYKIKQKVKEEKKRQEWLERNDPGTSGGQKLGHNTNADSEDKKSLRTDYNPLMGDSSGSYRAPKRSPCGGGGCGK